MDLTLQLNDTFTVYTVWQDSIPAVVDSVYLMNGLKHIRFNLNIFSFQNAKFEFIESIGTNAGITYQGETGVIIPEQLLCKYTDSIRVYANTEFNGQCYVMLSGVPEYFEQHRSAAFPNPINRNNWLNFNNGNVPHQSIQLFDLQGNIIRKESGTQIKMSEPPGLYFIKLIGNSGKLEIVKVIVVE